MNLLLVIILLLVLFGGGSFYSYGYSPYAGGGIGVVGLVIIVLLLSGVFGRF